MGIRDILLKKIKHFIKVNHIFKFKNYSNFKDK